jgi:hypothetical protein
VPSFDLLLLTERSRAILAAREQELHLEQASHGLDRCDELSIQALLHAGLGAFYDVERELHYPSSLGKRSARPRCDFVLTPHEAHEASEPLWLEVKVAHQLHGSGRPHPRYAHQWRRSLFADLRKMQADPQIVHGAFALIVFNDAQSTFDRDVQTFERLLFDEGLVAGYRSAQSIAIDDRMGHTRCSVVAWPL